MEARGIVINIRQSETCNTCRAKKGVKCQNTCCFKLKVWYILIMAMDTRKEATMTGREMIEKFVCPGCVCGSDTRCTRRPYITAVDGKNVDENTGGLVCEAHVLGTYITDIGHVALGLPKGFNRAGVSGNRRYPDRQANNTMLIRCWIHRYNPGWDKFNVAVWALEKDGFLFVRTYQPRINFTVIDIVESGTLELVPDAIDVSEFYDEMD